MKPKADKHVEAVIARLRERSETGIRKYGTTTEFADLTLIEWLRHLQEELLDGAVYIEAALNCDVPAPPESEHG